ncbi:MAG: proton-conducting transporter membrane subunit [Stellaceae bacterium]
MDLIFIGFFAVLAIGIGLYAVSVPQDGRVWWWLAAAITVLVIASKLIGDSWTAAIFLDLAELAAVALVWSHGTPEAAAAGRKYLYSIVPAIACTLIAGSLVGTGAEAPGPTLQKLVVCLLIVGFALKLGLIPFYFWLPAVASAAAPMTTALIVSVVDIATFGELAALREVSPWVFGEYAPVWMVVALLSMSGGALLALAQTELKRMLAFSTINDMGFLLLGLIIGGPAGIAGASLGALNHALSKVILFGAVGFAERQIGRTVTLDTSGLAARLPLTGAAFIIGALVFIGVPPGFGFVAYWRIYIAATQFGGPALITALLMVAALDLLCYARAIHRTWLGPAEIPVTGAPAYLAPAVLACLAVIAVLLGCYPSILTGAAASGLLAMAQ